MNNTVNENRNFVWAVQKTEDDLQLKNCLGFLLDGYSEIFGEEIMFGEACYVYNDPLSECPMLVRNRIPTAIRLSQKSLNYWAQTIYQLSHEMCHFAIRQVKPDKEFTLSWFEEVVCEAMSLYALDYAAKNWSKCELSKINPGFDKSIEEYLGNCLDEPATDGLASCNTLEKLRSYEKNDTAENDRATHRSERNAVYRAILENPGAVKEVCNYVQYVNPDMLTIDFGSWKSAAPSGLLDVLESVQPVK